MYSYVSHVICIIAHELYMYMYGLHIYIRTYIHIYVYMYETVYGLILEYSWSILSYM